MKIPEFGRDFLKSMDDFLRDNLPELTCVDIHKIYFDLFYEQKKWKGNAAGFTGLSEFLIFRFLIHQLGGDFEGVDVPKDKRKLDTANFRFRSMSNPRISIGNNLRLKGFGNDRPDIVIWLDEKIIAILQIKIYMSSGVAEVTKEFDNFVKYQAKHRGFRGFLLTYSNLSNAKTAKIRPELDRLRDENEWFDYLILENNTHLLAEELNEYLHLDRLSQ